MKRKLGTRWFYGFLAVALIVMAFTGAGCSSSSKDASGPSVTTEDTGQTITTGGTDSADSVRVTETYSSPAITAADAGPSASYAGSSADTGSVVTVEPTRPEVNVEIPPTKVTGSTSASLAPASSETIGLATGGAKDVGNFRENIDAGYLPLPSDISYEGLFYDYYFDTGETAPATKLFSPSYSFAVTNDPFSEETEYYLSVGLNSGLKESDFQRKKLNLVVVLDMSGSMKNPFDKYYYDRFGTYHEVPEVDFRDEKIEIATEVVTSMVDQLNEDDLFGMVAFNTDATLIRDLSPLRSSQISSLKKQILNISAYGSTHLSDGMEMATSLFEELQGVNQNEYENRIIFVTDAMPNTGDTSTSGLLGMARDNADNHIYTTFIGVGVDFNSELVRLITDMRGSNYYTVHSADQFRDRIDNEFEYMVTPLVFDLQLNIKGDGWRIEKIYGSPEADESTGHLMKVNTLFPSKKSGGETRGGLILLKLTEQYGHGGDIRLIASYEDRNGFRDSSVATFRINGEGPEYFDNTGIRKGILLARYANLMKDWIIDERQNLNASYAWEPSVGEYTGITIPEDFSQWERTSVNLNVSRGYQKLFTYFYRYFEGEANALHDPTLNQELDILQMLIND